MNYSLSSPNREYTDVSYKNFTGKEANFEFLQENDKFFYPNYSKNLDYDAVKFMSEKQKNILVGGIKIKAVNVNLDSKVEGYKHYKIKENLSDMYIIRIKV